MRDGAVVFLRGAGVEAEVVTPCTKHLAVFNEAFGIEFVPVVHGSDLIPPVEGDVWVDVPELIQSLKESAK